MLTSIVIRTYNESRHLDELLTEISRQRLETTALEVVIVDSGSTDNTLDIAGAHGCRITHIDRESFTFGRSLNIGCDFARGEILAFVSGHCIPATEHWLENLVRPLTEGIASYSYGRQVGRDTTKFSEARHFRKYYPEYSKLPQEGFFCNNANAAVRRDAWAGFRFNEELTGLEDMYLARQLVEAGHRVAYVADAPVYHIHDESWRQVKLRFEREAIALQKILPHVHFTLVDFLRYFPSGVYSDMIAALREGRLPGALGEIVLFRFMHYWGTYSGSREIRELSSKEKRNYFYPQDLERSKYEER